MARKQSTSQEELEQLEAELHIQVVALGLAWCFTYKHGTLQRCKSCRFKRKCEIGFLLNELLTQPSGPDFTAKRQNRQKGEKT